MDERYVAFDVETPNAQNRRLVVMDIEYYERTMQKMYEAKAVLDGLADVKSGKVVDGKAAIQNIRSRYGI
mgnify:CR=1 FL=1